MLTGLTAILARDLGVDARDVVAPVRCRWEPEYLLDRLLHAPCLHGFLFANELLILVEQLTVEEEETRDVLRQDDVHPVVVLRSRLHIAINVDAEVLLKVSVADWILNPWLRLNLPPEPELVLAVILAHLDLELDG